MGLALVEHCFVSVVVDWLVYDGWRLSAVMREDMTHGHGCAFYYTFCNTNHGSQEQEKKLLTEPNLTFL